MAYRMTAGELPGTAGTVPAGYRKRTVEVPEKYCSVANVLLTNEDVHVLCRTLVRLKHG